MHFSCQRDAHCINTGCRMLEKQKFPSPFGLVVPASSLSISPVWTHLQPYLPGKYNPPVWGLGKHQLWSLDSLSGNQYMAVTRHLAWELTLQESSSHSARAPLHHSAACMATLPSDFPAWMEPAYMGVVLLVLNGLHVHHGQLRDILEKG